jgi:hypothetical protein
MQAMIRDKATRFLGAYRAPAEWENTGLVAAGVGTVICGLYVAVRTVLLVIGTHFSLLQWDEWEVLARYFAFMTGKLSLMSWLWEQHNEHRVVLARLLFALDAEIAGGTQVLTKSVSLVLCVSLAALFMLQLSGLKRIPWGVRLIGAGLLIILFLSNHQVENFIRGFNNQVLTVVLFSVLALYLLVKSIEQTPVDRRAYVLLFCALFSGVLATVSMSNGLVIWPVLLVVCVRFRNWRWALAVVLVGAVATIAYLWDYRSPGGHPNPLDTLKQPIAFLHFFLAILGNSVGFQNLRISTLFGTFGILLMAYHFFRQGWHSDRDSPTVWFLLGVCLFVIGTAGLTAVGRLGFGVEHALALRYSSYVSPSWAAILILGFILLKKNLEKYHGNIWIIFDAGTLIVPAAICGGIFLAQSTGRNFALAEYEHYQRAATAIVAGAPDQVALQYAFYSPAIVLSSVPYLASNRLSIFHSSVDYFLYQKDHDALHKPLSDGMLLDGKWCVGWIDEIKSVTNVGQAVSKWSEIIGWALDREIERPPDGILFSDDEGRLVGVARMLFPRPDVDKALKLKHTQMLVQYIGYAEAGNSQSIIGYAFRADKNNLCRFGERKMR